MGLCWCTITVNDMDTSIAFYRDIVGLALASRNAAGPGMDIAFLGDNGTQVELICRKDKPAAGAPEGVSLGFDVPSLEDKMAFVQEQGIKITAGPFRPNPHVQFFFVKDPNGLEIQFVQRG
jgi:lactoylglutathione lyase